MKFVASSRTHWKFAALLFGAALSQAPNARAQTATAPHPALLPPSIAESPALRAFTVAPFANADVKPGEILLLGYFVASTNPKSVTIKAVSYALPSGKTADIDPAKAKEITLQTGTVLWANAQKRDAIDWEQVLDGAPVYAVGVDGGAGKPLVARKIEVLDGFVGDLPDQPETPDTPATFGGVAEDDATAAADKAALRSADLPPHAMWLESVGTDQMTSGYTEPLAGKSIGGNPIKLGGVIYPHGIGTHAESDVLLDLKGKATRFVSMVGVDDEITSRGSIVFSVWVDGVKVAGSSILRVGSAPELLSVDLKGAKYLRLQVGDAGDSANSDHADWAGAMLELTPTTDATNPSSTPSARHFPELTGNQDAPDERALRSEQPLTDTQWLETLGVEQMSAGFGRPQIAKTIGGNPLMLDDRIYRHGIGTHAPSRFVIDLRGNATRFAAMVGVDDEVKPNGSVAFSVWVDGQRVADSGVMRAGQVPQLMSVNLVGASLMELRADDGDDGKDSDHADWAGALIRVIPDTDPTEYPQPVELETLGEQG